MNTTNNLAVSVIMPVFNAEKYLEEALNSVLEQDFDSYEFICVDDGSCDRSLEILQSYSKQHQRMTVISQKNLGGLLARKTGFDAARGEYILSVDADDILMKDALKDLYAPVQAENADIVIGNYIKWIFYKNQEELINLNLDKTKKLNVIDLLKIDNSTLWNKLIKRSLLKEIKYPPLRLADDLAIVYQAAIEADTIVFISKPVYRYRIHPQSVTYTTDVRILLDIRLSLDTVINGAKKSDLFEKNIDFWSTWKVRHCTFQLWRLPFVSIREGFLLQDSIKEYLKSELVNVKEEKVLQLYRRLISRKLFFGPWYWAKKILCVI